jgi:hypothetical protein
MPLEDATLAPTAGKEAVSTSLAAAEAVPVGESGTWEQVKALAIT